MTLPKYFPKLLLKFRSTSFHIVQIISHMFHNPGNFPKLLRHCQPVLNHTVVPYLVHFLQLKILKNCMVILHGTPAEAHPVPPNLLDFFFLSTFQCPDQQLCLLTHLFAPAFPADFSPIASGTHLFIGIFCNLSYLSAA